MVVTRNVFSHRLTVHRKYDLKVALHCLFYKPTSPRTVLIIDDFKDAVSVFRFLLFLLPTPLRFQGSTVSREASDKEKVCFLSLL